MGAAAAALTIGGMVTGAMGARGAARAAQRQARFNQQEAQRAQQQERERVDLIRSSPGAAASPLFFNSIIDVFTKSMAGRMSGAGQYGDLIRQAMGLTNQDGSLGPLWYGFNAYQNHAKNRNNPAGDQAGTQPRRREGALMRELIGRDSGVRGN